MEVQEQQNAQNELLRSPHFENRDLEKNGLRDLFKLKSIKNLKGVSRDIKLELNHIFCEKETEGPIINDCLI